MRALILGLLLAIATVSPALAQTPSPVFVDFEDQAVGTDDPLIAGARFGSALQCPSQILGNDGNGGGRYFFTCGETEIALQSAQARVAFFYRIQAASGPTLTAVARDGAGTELDRETIGGAAVNGWSPLVLAAPDGAPRITRVELTTSEGVLGIDDVGFSPLPQPDTVITAGPPDPAGSGDASFAFTANGQPSTGFRCSLDGAAPAPCESPVAYSGLADGPHAFTVAAVDRWGATDATPAGSTWTVRTDSNGDGVPDALDRNRDGVLDAVDPDGDSVPDDRDNCPDRSNPGQADADRDHIGNACETLPSGTIAATAGRSVTVRLLSGVVFVKLAPGASSAFTAGLGGRVPFQDTGFVPLKGKATVPVGSIFDARRGALGMRAATNAPLKGSIVRRRRARFRTGVFAILQARARRRSRRTIAARAVLVSPERAVRPCQAPGPPNDTRVRALTADVGRAFRVVGGASRTVTIKGRAAVTVTDRCNGTTTAVRRGRVRVIPSRGGRRRVVRAGQDYRVRARLFAARKGRLRAARPAA